MSSSVLVEIMKELYIFGTGGLGKETTKLVEDINAISSSKYNIAAYIVSHPEETSFMGKDVISKETFVETITAKKRTSLVLAIGTPAIKREIVQQLSEYNVEYPCLVHPSSPLNHSVNHQEGLVVFANVLFMVDIAIGKHTFINSACLLGHDVEIGEFVQINPHCCISGDVKINCDCLIGAGSVIYQGVTIENGATVGMGAVVLRNVKPGSVVFGNPARNLPTNQ